MSDWSRNIPGIESVIEGSNRLTEIFGYWPTFHDAEVIDLHLWRGDVDPKRASYVFPVLTVKLHHWELSDDVDAQGLYVLRHHTLSTLRFHQLLDDFRMEGFNHQNAIFGLTIKREERTEGPTPVFVVEFQHAHGMAASFSCLRVEVVNATPCTKDGVASR